MIVLTRGQIIEPLEVLSCLHIKGQYKIEKTFELACCM
jgi:hypothetical protein